MLSVKLDENTSALMIGVLNVLIMKSLLDQATNSRYITTIIHEGLVRTVRHRETLYIEISYLLIITSIIAVVLESWFILAKKF